MDAPLVAIVACHGQGLFELGCATGVFAPLRAEREVAWYRTVLCAGEPGALLVPGGVQLQLPAGLEVVDDADLVVLPGWRDPAERPPQALLEAVRRAHARGARIAAICSGAFVLAWAGLLDGHAATTHWRLLETLARTFPKVTVREDVLYVEDGGIITSAGSAAGMDMLLHLVRKDYGMRVANLVAERLVLAPWRDPDRRQRVPRSMAPGDPRRLSQLMESVRSSLQATHCLKTLAEQAALSQRTLQRQFLQATGLSPIDWLIRERVAYARELLETTDRPLHWVAERSGFGSPESFRRHFRSQTGQSPASYRSALPQGLWQARGECHGTVRAVASAATAA